MATNIEEALQGAGAVSAKPVTMEALPEATIDVGGGSQSLEIEGLGVKRRKDDLSVVTASTSQLAIQDLFGDLLDEVNFSDPSSVDAFKDSAASRISELDSDSIGNFLGEASSVAGDLAAFSTAFTGGDTSQNQFRRVFGPPATLSVSGDSGGDFDSGLGSGFDSGLDTSTSTAAQDFSDLANPEAAAGLVSGAFGALGPGGSLGGFATGVGRGAFSSAGVADVFGGFNAASSLANAEISNPAQAIGAVANALQVGETVNSIAAFAQQNKSIEDIFSDVTKNVQEYVENIYSAITNPEQTLGAFGMQMAYGTLTPDLYSFEFPGGPLNFAFDAKTGMIAEPGFLSFMMGRSPLGPAYSLAQRGLDAVGYKEAMADRNQSAINAFSMPGINLGPMSIHNSNLEASIGVDPQTGAASTVGAFGAIDMSAQGFGTVGMDLGALAEAMGAGTIGDLSFTDYQDAAITGHLGHGPLGFDAYSEEEAMAEDMAAAFGEAGINNAQDIADRAEEASMATANFAASLESITGLDLASIEAVDVAGRAGALSHSQAAAARDMAQTDPVGYAASIAQALGNMAADKALGYGYVTDVEARQAAAPAVAAAYYSDPVGIAEGVSQDYNSQDPSLETLEAMNRAGLTNTINLTQAQKEKLGNARLEVAFEARQKSIADKYEDLNLDLSYDLATTGMEGAKGSFDAGFGDLSKEQAQQAYDEDPLSAEDAPGDMDPGGAISAGYDIGFDAASQEASSEAAGGSAGAGAGAGAGAAAGAAAAADRSDQDAMDEVGDFSGVECFIPTAQVTMSDGSNKQIKDIEVGNKVMNIDGGVNTVVATSVFNLGNNKIHGFNGKKPFVTSMHPILTKEGWKNFNPQAYKESWPEDYEKVASENADGVIHEITENDELAWKNGADDVTYVSFKDSTTLNEDPNFKVYNLTLDGDHTFIVEGLVVHNKEDDKIICTAMNKMYGFGSYRNALWMKYQSSHMAAEEYELGYHKLVMPLVKKMPTNKTIRTVLEKIARRRTINIRKELRGQKLPLYYRSMKYTVRPLLFAVGWLVKKNLLSKTKI